MCKPAPTTGPHPLQHHLLLILPNMIIDWNPWALALHKPALRSLDAGDPGGVKQKA